MKSKPEQLVLLRNSERTTFKRCRQQWDWAYNSKLKTKRPAAPLRFGNLVHDALEQYYKPGKKRGVHPAKTFAKLYEQDMARLGQLGMRDEDGAWNDAGDLGVAMLNHYIETYGKDDNIEVIAPEMPFEIDIHDKRGRYMVTMTGKMDVVIKDHSYKKPQIGLLEHKTARTISTDHLWGDEQAGSYWTFAPQFLKSKGIIKPDDDLDFILYNFLRKAKKDERPTNAIGQFLNEPKKDALLRAAEGVGLKLPKQTVETLTAGLEDLGVDVRSLGEVSKSQPSAYFLRQRIYRDAADRGQTLFRVRAESYEMAQVRAGKLAVYKNPTRDCGFCEFRDMCEVHETGGDWKSVRNATMTTWEPYGDHEEMEGYEEATS